MAGPEEPLLAVDEIQGNILPGFNTRHQVLIGVRFDSGQTGRAAAWLGSMIDSISTLRTVNAVREERREALRTGGERPVSPVFTNLALDVQGLGMLAPGVDGIRDPAFLLGMGEESNLGDPIDPAHEGHPSRWVVGGSSEKTPQALMVLGGDDLEDLRKQATLAREAIAAAGLALVYDEEGHVLEGETEHFGFRDGISQVGPRGLLPDGAGFLTRRYIDPADERATCFARPGQPLIWPGQFVFGYVKQRDDDVVKPGTVSNGGYPWMDNGSYLVLRRLRQDVAAFRRFLQEESGRLGITPERLAAVLVGRWPRGTPLVRNPEGDDPDPGADRFAINHFGFADDVAPVTIHGEGPDPVTVPGAPGDRFGRVCPGFAHVRKVNPRDLVTDQGGPDHTLTLHVLRRGVPWGDPYPSDPTAQEGDDGQRGLLFLSYQASIEKQFKVLNTRWMNRADGPEGGTGHDLLVGQGAGTSRQRTVTFPGSSAEPVRLTAIPEWVIPTGGGYFFAPSVSALRSFAARR